MRHACIRQKEIGVDDGLKKEPTTNNLPLHTHSLPVHLPYFFSFQKCDKIRYLSYPFAQQCVILIVDATAPHTVRHATANIDALPHAFQAQETNDNAHHKTPLPTETSNSEVARGATTSAVIASASLKTVRVLKKKPTLVQLIGAKAFKSFEEGRVHSAAWTNECKAELSLDLE